MLCPIRPHSAVTVIDSPTDIMAFAGGFLAGRLEGFTLKQMFAIMLASVSVFMFIKVKERPILEKHTFGYWNRTLIMLETSVAFMIIFNKNKKVDWKLALLRRWRSEDTHQQ